MLVKTSMKIQNFAQKSALHHYANRKSAFCRFYNNIPNNFRSKRKQTAIATRSTFTDAAKRRNFICAHQYIPNQKNEVIGKSCLPRIEHARNDCEPAMRKIKSAKFRLNMRYARADNRKNPTGNAKPLLLTRTAQSKMRQAREIRAQKNPPPERGGFLSGGD